jgi:hypothetical protein
MLRVLGLSLVVLIGSSACGDDADPPDECDASPTSCAGTGGSKPIAGTGGSEPVAGSADRRDSGAVQPDSGAPADSGTDGASDGVQPPSCVRELMDSCLGFEGACRSQVGDGGPIEAYCYDSGVRIETSQEGDGCAGSRYELRVRKPDGSPCFTLERQINFGTSCETGRYTWRDAMGATVATGALGTAHFAIECTAGGDSLTCDAPGCPRDPLFGRGDCEDGECSAATGP